MVFICCFGCSDKSDKDGIKKGTVTDIEGNIYKTIKIGGFWWMAENLRVTKYTDGKEITHIRGNTEWEQFVFSSYCWYNNDSLFWGTVYGALYKWPSVITGRLCPEGWRVPSEGEWSYLISILGGEGAAGGKLKEAGTEHWLSPNKGATNESGFRALPGGRRDKNGTFLSIRESVTWWSTSEIDDASAYSLSAYYKYSEANILISSKNAGYSVRCMKE